MYKFLTSIVCLSMLPVPVLADHEFVDRDIRSGEKLYAEHCASCHGINLEGKPNWRTPNEDGILPAPPHNETGHTWHHDNQLLFDYTRLGGEAALAERGISNFKSGMPGFMAVVSDEQIWSILAYIRSTWPSKIQEIQSAKNAPHQ